MSKRTAKSLEDAAPDGEMLVYHDLYRLHESLANLSPSLFATSVIRSHLHAFLCRQTLQGEIPAFFALSPFGQVHFRTSLLLGIAGISGIRTEALFRNIAARDAE